MARLLVLVVVAALALVLACGRGAQAFACPDSRTGFWCAHEEQLSMFYQCSPPHFEGWRPCPAGLYCTTQGYHNANPCTPMRPAVGGFCGDGTCAATESCATCPLDCPCPAVCGDGNCESSKGETCSTCASDCGTCAVVCGDGNCDATETVSSCPQDCSVCGNGVCEAGENCNSCAFDCRCVCGDGTCDSALGESCSSCAADCGTCPPRCGDGQCRGDETCLSCPGDCGSCGFAGCGDGVCSASENCDTCQEDCGFCACNDNHCSPDIGENFVTCSQDCRTLPPMCGDGVCQASNRETVLNCPSDCLVVAGYVPDYSGASIGKVPANLLTDQVYFSLEIKYDGTLDYKWATLSNIRNLSSVAAASGQDAWVCIGGWGRSAGFPIVSRSPTALATFFSEIIQFCVLYKYQGVVLDWEFPADITEINLFTQMVADMRRALSPHSLKLAIAVPGTKQIILGTAANDVDLVHVMSYDHGYPHSTLAHATSDMSYWNRLGFPKDKLLLAVPFYGRSLTTSYAYKDLVARYQPAPNVDWVGENPLRPDIYFNNYDTVVAKSRMVTTNGYRGVICWEMGMDLPASDERSLIRAINQQLRAVAPSSASTALVGVLWMVLAGAATLLAVLTL